jgi:hypothetical protein
MVIVMNKKTLSFDTRVRLVHGHHTSHLCFRLELFTRSNTQPAPDSQALQYLTAPCEAAREFSE